VQAACGAQAGAPAPAGGPAGDGVEREHERQLVLPVGHPDGDAHRTSNADVGPTVYWFVIWEDNTIIQRCGTGTTCSVSVSYPTPQTHGFSVEISYYDGSNS